MKIYTDGGYSQKEKQGKAALIIVDEEDVIIYKKSYLLKNATNNIAEMAAFLKALQIAKYYTSKYNKEITIYSDSQYVVKGYKEWCNSWRKNGWINSKGEEVKNKALWLKIDAIRDDLIKVEWVKGHNEKSGSKHAYFNSIVDKLTR